MNSEFGSGGYLAVRSLTLDNGAEQGLLSDPP
jgi:hypothetical protein